MVMAISKTLIASLLVSLLIFHLAEADHNDMMSELNEGSTGRTLLQKIDCAAKCSGRCRLSSRPRLCNRACGTCCQRCNCVPPGTSGNEDVCPCYANMTTHGGEKKCP